MSRWSRRRAARRDSDHNGASIPTPGRWPRTFDTETVGASHASQWGYQLPALDEVEQPPAGTRVASSSPFVTSTANPASTTSPTPNAGPTSITNLTSTGGAPSTNGHRSNHDDQVERDHASSGEQGLAPVGGSDDVATRIRSDYDAALASAGVILFQQVRPGGDEFHVSASMVDVLGWDPSAFGRPAVLRSIVHPADLPAFDAALPTTPGVPLDPWVETATVIDLTDHGSVTEIAPAARVEDASATPVVRFRDSRGRWRKLQIRLADPSGNPPGGRAGTVQGSLIDVTVEERHHESARRFAEIVEHDPSGCLVLEFIDRSDPSSLVIRSANEAAHRMFDLDRRVVDGTPIGAVLGEASAQLIRHALFDVCHTGQSMTAERLSLGEVRGTYLDLRVDRLSDGTLGMTVTDVTGTVALEERLRHQASHDALTGLPNRALLEERLDGAVAAATADGPVALAVIDVDQLSALNERLGLHLGDRLLVELGRRLVREVQGAAVVSRLGGDEFAVLTMPCNDDGQAIDRILGVRAALARPFDVAGHLVECSTSIGVALAPSHSDDGRSLLRLAQGALEVAKQDGSGLHVHEPNGAPNSISRLALLTELRQGLANRDLELHYQPIVDLRSGRVTKVEAHLRWHENGGSARLPMEFVELAEQSGLIRPLSRWTLGEVAAAAATLADAGLPLVVTTNVAMRNLFDQDLDGFLQQLVASGELRPELVELEISEPELMDDPGRAHETLTRLSDLGIRFVVDEFGTGYTSLSTMQQLPVVGLKIDRSFIERISSDASDAAIVRSTIELSHELGISIGADGVQDARTLSQLASYGCDSAQGTHLSGPVPRDELAKRIVELESAVRGWLGTAEALSD